MVELFVTYWPFLIGLLLSGVLAGILAGLLGVGGGIVVVPVLFHVFTAIGIDEEIRMHLAVGTSLATIIPTSIRSIRSHAKRGAVEWGVLKSWSIPLFVGVLLGAAVAGFVDGRILTAVFGVLALFIAANMAFSKESWRLGEGLPSGLPSHGMATSIGGLSAVMGIGGGTFGVPIMTLFGMPAHRAVATSSGLGLIISIPGAIGFVVVGWNEPNLPIGSLGYVNVIGFALIAPMTVLAAPLGVHLAHALPKERLKQAFALFLALTSVRMLVDFFN